jgi:hypothetical protein
MAVAWKLASRSQGDWSALRPAYYAGMGFSWIITTLLVGLAASRFNRLSSWWGIGLGTVAGWFVVMGLMMLLLRVASPSVSEPKFANTDEMMKHFASEAALWVKQDKGIELDYSLDSIKVIEEQLAQLSKTVDKANPQPGMRGQAVGYGAYIGEVLRRKDGGSWAVDHPNGWERSYPLTLKSNVVVFPAMWSWKRIINGEQDNIYHKAVILTTQEGALTNVLEIK